jgi:hypothetical protein
MGDSLQAAGPISSEPSPGSQDCTPSGAHRVRFSFFPISSLSLSLSSFVESPLPRHERRPPSSRALSSPPWFATPQRRSTQQSPQRHVVPTSAFTSKTPAKLPRLSMAWTCKRPFRTSTTSVNTSKPSPSGDSKAASDAQLKERSLALISVAQLC